MDKKEHPIIMSSWGVNAILREENPKTETRRIIKPSNSFYDGSPVTQLNRLAWDNSDWENAYIDPGPSPAGNPGPYLKLPLLVDPWPDTVHRVYPRIQPGDRLWVREKFSYLEWSPNPTRGPIWYWADGAVPDGDWTRPKPSIHMPRKYSRITLEVLEVYPQRIQDISEESARAEGIDKPKLIDLDDAFLGLTSYQIGFKNLWNSIHGKDAWSRNDWVWATRFKRVENA